MWPPYCGHSTADSGAGAAALKETGRSVGNTFDFQGLITKRCSGFPQLPPGLPSAEAACKDAHRQPRGGGREGKMKMCIWELHCPALWEQKMLPLSRVDSIRKNMAVSNLSTCRSHVAPSGDALQLSWEMGKANLTGYFCLKISCPNSSKNLPEMEHFTLERDFY